MSRQLPGRVRRRLTPAAARTTLPGTLNPLKIVRRLVPSGRELVRRMGALEADVDAVKVLAARALIRDTAARGVLPRIRDAEFRAFSQFGDDGIIQYLIRQVRPLSDSFIEFGVESYRESNTRFLLENDNWRGLIMDGSEEWMAEVRASDLHWRHDLTAAAAFVTRENVNELFAASGFAGEIGLLSIDIDGNDYWVWERVSAVAPAIVVIEYNSAFGPNQAVTVPYDAAFRRAEAHFSNQYWGASLKAFWSLAEKKGYAFVGCNGAGNNAYFVRRERLGSLRAITAEEGFVDARWRDSRDADGRLTFLSGRRRLEPIAAMPLVDVERGVTVKVADVAAALGPPAERGA